MSLRDRVRAWFGPPAPIEPGIYHYRSSPDEPTRYRLHLRVERDGSGLLAINASTVLHLNPTAVEHAKYFIDGLDTREAGRRIAKRYNVSAGQAEDDTKQFRDTMQRLVSGDDVCPISYMNIQRTDPFQTPTSAPYRVDLALTYRCDNYCDHCYVERPRETAEMSTEEWKRAMDALWKIGVPHLCFTGGEATLRDDLEGLITYAEDVGFVTGLLTNGRRLGDRPYLDSLVAAGLDHVQITLESHDQAVHNAMVCADAWRDTVGGVKNAVAAGLYTITNTTLTGANIHDIGRTVDFAAGLGVKAFACNGLIYTGQAKRYHLAVPEEDLTSALGEVAAAAERNGIRFIWYTPTQYCHLNPIELELGIKSCTAAKYNVCVEPNGQVIPCQSYYQSLGHILRDPWDSIWNHPIARHIRDKGYLPAKCDGCEHLPLCGGGCPLYLEHQSYLCVESQSTHT